VNVRGNGFSRLTMIGTTQSLGGDFYPLYLVGGVGKDICLSFVRNLTMDNSYIYSLFQIVS
jgi:hypothetical protein